MLSYRHAFHAGNFADVLKHSVLTYILDYMARKDKGYSYIDTHSGAGMYQLASQYAQKTGEYKQGIEKLYQAGDLDEVLSHYVEVIHTLNHDKALTIYPGSPGIAKHMSRRQDNAHLYELHSSDYPLLTQFCERWRKSNVYQQDGYQGLLKQLPPATRRGVVLVDPPFELKEDYKKSVNTLISAYKKFATGTYVLWYPVVDREYIDMMEKLFTDSDVKNLIQIEYCQSPDTQVRGMTGTGLFVINPPWQLLSLSEALLANMKKYMGGEHTSYRAIELISE